MAKTVQVSDDAGVTWYTLPGSSADFNDEGATADDTVFGQSFQSQQPTLISWTCSANAVYKGFAGYVAELKKAGTPTATTGEAASLVSGKTYQIDDPSKRIWDRTVAIVVNDNGTPVAASNIASIDYLFGKVTFISSFTPAGAITLDVTYLTAAPMAKGRSFTLTMQANAVDTLDFDAASANGGYRTHEPGLRTVSLDISGVFSTSYDFRAILQARSEIIIEIDPTGTGESVMRGFFRLATVGQSGDVGDLEQQDLTFSLSVPNPDSKAEVPISWSFGAGAVLSQSVQKCINAWLNENLIDVRYLHDGTNGYTGEAVVTDISLATDIEGLNEFSAAFQGSGATTAVP